MIFSWRGRIITGVGVFLGIIGIFYGIFYYPAEKQVKMIESQIAREKLRILQLKKKSQECEVLKEECTKLKNEIGEMEQEFPPEEQIYPFLRDMGLRASLYEIDYLNISVGKISTKGYYQYIPLEVHLYATYHKLGMLLSDLSQRKRMSSFKVDKFRIRGLKEEERKERHSTIEASLSLSISLYRYSLSSPTSEKEIISSSRTVGERRR
ncbi:type 4a pilus biogenesis protein PilO [Candidatus Aerophobetes bacterium]|mgnify:CR=1 FL=1|nr:type 4a pilus biogenesis protein PilO [Candidatus Aerophobetes bacterium]